MSVYGLIILVKKINQKELQNEINITAKVNYLQLLVKGFLLNFINIGVLVFWLGIVVVIGPSLENDLSRFVVFFSIVILSYFITDFLKIILAKKLKKKLTPSIIVKTKKTLGAILVFFGLILIIKGFLPKDNFNTQNIINSIKK